MRHKSELSLVVAESAVVEGATAMFVAVGEDGGLVWCPSRRVWMRLPEYRAGSPQHSAWEALAQVGKEVHKRCGENNCSLHGWAGAPACTRGSCVHGGHLSIYGASVCKGKPACTRGRGLKGNSHCFSEEGEFVV